MKLRVIIDRTTSVYTTSQAIKRGIGDRTTLNQALQETYETMRRLKVIGLVEHRRGYHIQMGKR